jgi:hypothetical protein
MSDRASGDSDDEAWAREFFDGSSSSGVSSGECPSPPPPSRGPGPAPAPVAAGAPPVAAIPAPPSPPRSVAAAAPLAGAWEPWVVSCCLRALAGEATPLFAPAAPAGGFGAAAAAAAWLFPAGGAPPAAAPSGGDAVLWLQRDPCAALPPAHVLQLRALAGALASCGDPVERCAGAACVGALLRGGGGGGGGGARATRGVPPAAALFARWAAALLADGAARAFAPVAPSPPPAGAPGSGCGALPAAAAGALPRVARAANAISWLGWAAAAVGAGGGERGGEGAARWRRALAAAGAPASPPALALLPPLACGSRCDGGGGDGDAAPSPPPPLPVAAFFGATPRALAGALARAAAAARADAAALSAYHAEWCARGAGAPAGMRAGPPLTFVGLLGWLAGYESALCGLTGVARAAFYGPPPLPAGGAARAGGGGLPAALAAAAAALACDGQRLLAARALDAAAAAAGRAASCAGAPAPAAAPPRALAGGGAPLCRAAGSFPAPPPPAPLLLSALADTLSTYLGALDGFMHGRLSRCGDGGGVGEGGEEEEGEELPYAAPAARRAAARGAASWVAGALAVAAAHAASPISAAGSGRAARLRALVHAAEDASTSVVAVGDGLVAVAAVGDAVAAGDGRVAPRGARAPQWEYAGAAAAETGEIFGDEGFRAMAPYSPAFLRAPLRVRRGGGGCGDGAAAEGARPLHIALAVRRARTLLASVSVPEDVLASARGAGGGAGGISAAASSLARALLFRALPHTAVVALRRDWAEGAAVEAAAARAAGAPASAQNATADELLAPFSVCGAAHRREPQVARRNLNFKLLKLRREPRVRRGACGRVWDADLAAGSDSDARACGGARGRSGSGGEGVGTPSPGGGSRSSSGSGSGGGGGSDDSDCKGAGGAAARRRSGPRPRLYRGGRGASAAQPALSPPPVTAAAAAAAAAAIDAAALAGAPPAAPQLPAPPLMPAPLTAARAPLAKPVLGAGLAPLPGQRLSAWWGIDAQVEVPKREKGVGEESGGGVGDAPAAGAPPPAPSTTQQRQRPRPRLHKLDISVIQEGDEGGESSDTSDSEDSDTSDSEEEMAEGDEGGAGAGGAGRAPGTPRAPAQAPPAAPPALSAAPSSFFEEHLDGASSDGGKLEEQRDGASTDGGNSANSSVCDDGSGSDGSSGSGSDDDGSGGGGGSSSSSSNSGSIRGRGRRHCGGSVRADSSSGSGSGYSDSSGSESGNAPPLLPHFVDAAAAWALLSGAAGVPAARASAEWDTLARLCAGAPGGVGGGRARAARGAAALGGEPLRASLARAVAVPLAAQKMALSRQLVCALLHPCAGDVLRHVWAVRAVFLLGQGQAMGGFLSRFFGALRVGAAAEALLPLPPAGGAAGSRYSGYDSGNRAGAAEGGSDAIRSSFALTMWLRESLSAAGPHLKGGGGGAFWLSPEDFSVQFCGWEAKRGADLAGGGVAIAYTAPYPAALLLHGDAQAGYGEVSAVLLRAEFTLRGLRALAHAARHSEEAVARALRRLAAPGLPQGARVASQLRALSRARAAALHATAAAHGHVARGVIEGPWAAFLHAAAAAGDVAALARAHDVYLAAVRAAAFVGPSVGAAGAQLCALWDRADALADAAAAFYTALVAAVESVAGFAEEAAEAEGLLRGGGAPPPRSRPHRQRALPLEPFVLAHAAEALGACDLLFVDAEAAGRAVERHVGFMARAARAAAAAGAAGGVGTLAAALEGYAEAR